LIDWIRDVMVLHPRLRGCLNHLQFLSEPKGLRTTLTGGPCKARDPLFRLKYVHST